LRSPERLHKNVLLNATASGLVGAQSIVGTHEDGRRSSNKNVQFVFVVPLQRLYFVSLLHAEADLDAVLSLLLLHHRQVEVHEVLVLTLPYKNIPRKHHVGEAERTSTMLSPQGARSIVSYVSRSDESSEQRRTHSRLRFSLRFLEVVGKLLFNESRR
tara:strand:- start:243 stop:716 length:474 start_codon:yes stop_codon:yes gene_type:complete